MFRQFVMCFLAVSVVFVGSTPVWADDHEHAHFDIAPYFLGGQLLTGGLDHGGTHTPPTVTVYGYEFGEDSFDPFNPADPGVNQAAGVGNLPAGAGLSYNLLGGLAYWDGAGAVIWTAPATAQITLLVGTQSRTLDGASGPQAGTSIQSVLGDGSVHKHFTTSLRAAPGAENIPGLPGYVEPMPGIYAFPMDLVLTHAGSDYHSNAFWLVFNHGLDETAHEAAMDVLVPEPASMSLLLAGLTCWRCRRR